MISFDHHILGTAQRHNSARETGLSRPRNHDMLRDQRPNPGFLRPTGKTSRSLVMSRMPEVSRQKSGWALISDKLTAVKNRFFPNQRRFRLDFSRNRSGVRRSGAGHFWKHALNEEHASHV
jgi:hypothetical protein